jgi:hypothetical protein
VSGFDERSVARAVVGYVSIAVALIVIAIGFARMIAGLQTGGYGSTAVTLSLVILGTGGGLMAFGIGLLIWEVSIRYGIRR